MKYENAADIFPAEVLRQVQKYAAGKLVYIPAGEKRLSWGESSGYRAYLRERNNEIRERFGNGENLEELAASFSLSFDTVRKIVYSKKEVHMEYKCSLSSAKEFAEAGRIEDWIHIYLLSDGNNKAFSDGLKIYDRYFIGPKVMPLSLFCRNTGPEDGLKYKIPAEPFYNRVAACRTLLEGNDDMPPLIGNYFNRQFELNDGNHRFEALTQMGVTEYPFIIWITDKPDYDDFIKHFAA